MTVRLIPVLRCKEAIDLIGDALLYAHKTDVENVEHFLMQALKHGTGGALPTAKKVQRAKVLIKQWEAEERRQEIQRLREKSRSK